MATLALVCAAGVSGTFLARRLAGPLPDVQFVVTTEFALVDVLPQVDGVLIGPQLAASVDVIRALAAPRPTALLPVEAMSPTGAMVAVDAVEGLLQILPAPDAHPREESRSSDV